MEEDPRKRFMTLADKLFRITNDLASLERSLDNLVGYSERKTMFYVIKRNI